MHLYTHKQKNSVLIIYLRNEIVEYWHLCDHFVNMLNHLNKQNFEIVKGFSQTYIGIMYGIGLFIL